MSTSFPIWRPLRLSLFSHTYKTSLPLNTQWRAEALVTRQIHILCIHFYSIEAFMEGRCLTIDIIEALSLNSSRNNRRHSMKSKCRLYSSYVNQIYHNTFKLETMWMWENDKRIQNNQNNTFVSRNNKTSEDD